jgi:uncharacterized protein DUF4124
MKALLLLLCFAAPAHADLYRWIDPETGSVKLSSVPPSDSSVSAEVVSYRAPALPKPPATAAVSKSSSTVQVLEARWSELMTRLTGLTPQDFQRGGEGLKQHIEAYEAVRVELDRLDPAGVARRNAESTSLIDRLRQGFAAQFSTLPPGQQK